MQIIETLLIVLFIKRHDVFAKDTEDVKLEEHNTTRLVEYLNGTFIQCFAVSAYEGAVARLPCGPATEGQNTTWMYAESIYNVTFTPMEDKQTAVGDGNLSIYYVTRRDQGVYQCNVGAEASSIVVLQVLDDDDEYNVVKPVTSHGPFPSPPVRLSPELVVYIRWFTWSGCSRCDQVGRQRRYGYCYVRYTETMSNTTNNCSDYNNTLLKDEDVKLLREFPDGIPCRLNLLPETVIASHAVRMRNNEIMIGLCKVPCKSEIFEVRGAGGELLERANNTEGVFSLCQREPPQPPPVARDIIFAARGAAVLIKCPGTTLQDIPVTWRVGNKEVIPRELDISTAGRIHLNARDHIVISAAEYADSNVYSCWQDEKLSGVVKLKLYCESRDKCGRRLALGALLCALALAYRVTHTLYQRQVRRARTNN